MFFANFIVYTLVIVIYNLLDFIYKNPNTYSESFILKNKKIMRTLFKVLRGFFYFLTIVMGVVYMRGEILFEWNFDLIKAILIPWYLIFCGLMVWYLIATFWVGNEKYVEDINKERIATRSFLIWCIIWIIFALLYVLMIK